MGRWSSPHSWLAVKCRPDHQECWVRSSRCLKTFQRKLFLDFNIIRPFIVHWARHSLLIPQVRTSFFIHRWLIASEELSKHYQSSSTSYFRRLRITSKHDCFYLLGKAAVFPQVGKGDECVSIAGANNMLWVTYEHRSIMSGFSQMGLRCPHFTRHHSVSAACLGHLHWHAGRYDWLQLLYVQ